MHSAESDRYEIAVIGMSGRFPGAASLEDFWRNLENGVETIRRFSRDELRQRGTPPERYESENFVPAAAPVDGVDLFDASFFGYSPQEAKLLDPQHRLFLECAWEAMENAGYGSRSLACSVGVFAGVSLSSYLLFNLQSNSYKQAEEDEFQVMIGSDKDFLSTRVSYKLNLKGPSLTVQTGCSTSLVATHLAVQNLLTYQCDLAIAGGVSVGVPQRTGYSYQEGGILSPDGHCRPFDSQAAGTLFGEGLGIVVLKRLEDALRDHDHIHALILGSAINNDGAAKIGYTAPSVEGQAEVIARAQAVAGITADTVGYVEAHGTATTLGDPVEVAALTKAFRQTSSRCGFCALGSVKSNIGHLDAAAGVAGLLKTILMLKHKQLVPSLYFREPNPGIDFSRTPFFVASEKLAWESAAPRRAGVSSFGIGGTNAHIVLEEAPPAVPFSGRKPFYILGLSAQTPSALDRVTDDLAAYLENSPDHSLPDTAYTLHIGREPFKYRRSLICANRTDALQSLRSRDRAKVFDGSASGVRPKIAFLFPGGGTQYPGMGKGLYDNEPEFQKQIDRCCELLLPHLGFDLRRVLYPHPETFEASAKALSRTSLGLPAIFITEYALVKLLASWGLKPDCMLGYSLGEYTAACISGVFSLESAIELVAFRGRLFETAPSGAMVSAYLPEQEARKMLDGNLSIAAINSMDQCVISGPVSAVENLIATFHEREIEFHRLHIDAAAHCKLVEPLMPKLQRFLSGLPAGTPSIPFLSNRTGTWISAKEAASPGYWVEHLRDTVRLADGIKTLLDQENLLVLEAGPSRTLTTLARAQRRDRAFLCFDSMRHPKDACEDLEALYATVAKLWNAGADVDWSNFYKGERRRRVPLPTYPFERQRFWIDAGTRPSTSRSSERSTDGAGQPGIYAPVWERAPIAANPLTEQPDLSNPWLILEDELGIGQAVCRLLRSQGERAISLRPDHTCDKTEGIVPIAPNSEAAFLAFLKTLALVASAPLRIIHLWSLTGSEEGAASEVSFFKMQERTLFSVMALLRALSTLSRVPPVRLLLVSNGTAQAGGEDIVYPEKTTWGALGRVIPQEFAKAQACVVDVPTHAQYAHALERIAVQVVEEARHQGAEALVAFRGHHRLALRLKAQDPTPTRKLRQLREGGVYLLTGGAGNLGPVITDWFASRVRCKVILTSRSPFPDKALWSSLLTEKHDAGGASRDRLRAAIRNLQEAEAKGSEVYIMRADVSDEADMRSVIATIDRRFGRLDGVIHLAGETGARSLRLISDLEQVECERQFRPKAGGSYTLAKLLAGKDIDFCALFSSTASILGGVGMAAYGAANCFLDSFAAAQSLVSGQRWISINWDGWLTGTSDSVAGGRTVLDEYAVSASAAMEAFHRILELGIPGQYIVSREDIEARIQRTQEGTKEMADSAEPASGETHLRPQLATEYVAPQTEIQRELASIWSDVLGVDRVGLSDSFFELGGNSLIGLRIIGRVKRTFGIEIPVTALFEAPTVHALAQLLSSQDAAPHDYEPARARGEMRRERHLRRGASAG